MTDLAAEGSVAVLSFTDQAYRETLAPGLEAIGLPQRDIGKAEVGQLLDDLNTQQLVLRLPHMAAIRAALHRDIQILPVFADIFSRGGPRNRVKNALWRYFLTRRTVPCISNHSLNASRSLIEEVGVPANQVVPWDWSHIPIQSPPKQKMGDPTAPTAFFAGTLSAAKGVGDCISAVAALTRMGVPLKMRFAGGGDTTPWQNLAYKLGVSEQVEFLGIVTNMQVRDEMRSHDFVIVPSRHSYPEGLPNTIYEGLAAQSVLVISDHPAFQGRLEPDRETLVFAAGDADALAKCLRRAIEDTTLYAAISTRAAAAHDKLYCGLDWCDLIRHFINDPKDERGWVAAHQIGSVSSISKV
ncbi:glycosyltransferase family 4 protein [Jannaschia sp. CCS1]|uniref:glycosyltransferase family 4 protein n=1 Tax=Jannaschia sp. (strain CCS1) TaxID=290400 RepID=UPI0035288667